MKNKHHIRGSEVTSSHVSSLLTLVVLLSIYGTLVTTGNSGRQEFISKEAHFTDTSKSGLAVVPASCPSDPHYVGECSTPICTATDSGPNWVLYATPGTCTFVVPSDVVALQGQAWGGGGGGGGGGRGTNSSGGSGGGGGYASSTVFVTPGETLIIGVGGGGHGGAYIGTGLAAGGNGGSSEGGDGGSSYSEAGSGGEGGGGSGIYRDTRRLLVAGGGGGGGGGDDASNNKGAPGGGGGLSGTSGTNYSLTITGGGGGSTVGGQAGAGLTSGTMATSGERRYGGWGGNNISGARCGGGGGAGGYYGGGGGGGASSSFLTNPAASGCAGGGGGSSFIGATNAATFAASGTTPGNFADPHYGGAAGTGGAGGSPSLPGAAGGGGRVYISWVVLPKCTISVSPNSVVGTQSSTLTWSSTDATAMSISGIGAVGLTGSTSVAPGVTTTYVGSVSGPTGINTCSATLKVLSCSVSFGKNPIDPGEATLLNYSSSGAASFTINNVGSVSTVAAGSVNVGPTQTTDYTGTVQNSDGSTKVVFLTSGTTWTTPADFFPPWKIEVIGGGGGGEDSYGGGGGAYSKITDADMTLNPGTLTYISIGAGGAALLSGGDTWLNVSANAAPTSVAGGVLAKGGGGGGLPRGVGGAASSGVGSTKYSGGNGGLGSATQRRPGGGGAAGPGGAGGAGGAGSPTTNYAKGGGGGGATFAGPGNPGAPGDTDGGNGGANGSDLGVGLGATGSAVATNGTAGGGGGGGYGSGSYSQGAQGGAGNIWTQTSNGAVAGPGGGSGGGGTGNGGLYGGGGGGAGSPGLGAPGIIVVTYSPVLPLSTTCPASLTVNPPSGTLTLNPTSIQQGGSSTLSWATIGASSWTINKRTATTSNVILTSGTSQTGSTVVAPGVSTIYSGTITGPSGSGTFAPVTLDVTCTPSTVWSCLNASTISSTTVTSQCAVSTNTTSCVSPGFCSNGSSVCNYPPPTFTPSSTLTGHLQVSPQIVKAGGTVKVYWNVANVSSCSVVSTNGDSWTGATSGSSGKTSSAINVKTTFTLTCMGLDNSTFTERVTTSLAPTFNEI